MESQEERGWNRKIYWMIKDQKLLKFGETHVYSLKDVQWLPNRVHVLKRKETS